LQGSLQDRGSLLQVFSRFYFLFHSLAFPRSSDIQQSDLIKHFTIFTQLKICRCWYWCL